MMIYNKNETNEGVKYVIKYYSMNSIDISAKWESDRNASQWQECKYALFITTLFVGILHFWFAYGCTSCAATSSPDHWCITTTTTCMSVD